MRLRRPCKHDRYDEHVWFGDRHLIEKLPAEACPGGEFLPDEALADIAWQFNEAVSLLREARGSVMVPADVHAIDEGLPAMQTALESIVALAASQVGEAELKQIEDDAEMKWPEALL